MRLPALDSFIRDYDVCTTIEPVLIITVLCLPVILTEKAGRESAFAFCIRKPAQSLAFTCFFKCWIFAPKESGTEPRSKAINIINNFTCNLDKDINKIHIKLLYNYLTHDH